MTDAYPWSVVLISILLAIAVLGILTWIRDWLYVRVGGWISRISTALSEKKKKHKKKKKRKNK